MKMNKDLWIDGDDADDDSWKIDGHDAWQMDEVGWIKMMIDEKMDKDDDYDAVWRRMKTNRQGCRWLW